jgi:aryl-alcohol dehydrogenase-like predicted oxidoreductase
LSRLALGTAQFGLKYGVTNNIGKVKESMAAEILKIAKDNDIKTLDTAIGYGVSESVLGNKNINSFDIISKIPPLKNNTDIESWVNFEVEASLERLSQKFLHGILLHNPDDLFSISGYALYKSMLKLKEKGLVKNIGISVYSPHQLEKIFLEYKYGFDIVQAPLNIIDRRMHDSGWITKLNEMRVKVHIRSVFLQGLLLLKKEDIPVKFKKWENIWNNWEQYIQVNNISPIEACLSYPLSLSNVDKVIVGVQNPSQLDQIINASKIIIDQNLPNIQSDDNNLINPSNWNKL